MAYKTPGRAKDEYGLTQKQRAFCDYYIADPFHPVECARKAGYAETTASAMATKILAMGACSAYISHRLPIADAERAAKARERIATGDEVNAFLSQVMRGEIKDAFGLDPGLSDRISAAKELRRVYDIADKYRSANSSTDDLSRSLDAFLRGEIASDTETQEDQPRRSQDLPGSPSVVDSDPTPTHTENIPCSTDKEYQLPRESGDFQNSDPQKNFENPITGG